MLIRAAITANESEYNTDCSCFIIEFLEQVVLFFVKE